MRRTVRTSEGYECGTVRKYVGETARTMGSDPAYAAHPEDASKRPAVFESWTAARDYLLMSAKDES